ncbi:SA1362 family protein [Geomicrobium sp. JCM 19039]|uniref:SA1362 family protein n=1 Tax=Geomicrobium sp. JCM 19039 TaxID=1460636 RepID=UPI00045F42FD|nr:SA1362 family protein [Geomicrobium sp. JCM 19039]GAK12786.1 hypothetical protein JCM19039_2587 [Geomicrobium sp. JCM 19039]
MRTIFRNPFVLGIVLLAIVGLVSQLFTNPSGLMLTFLLMALFAFLFYFIFTRFVSKRTRVDPQYKRALKQDRERRKSTAVKNKDQVSVKKKRNGHNLKVIQGNKKNARR